MHYILSYSIIIISTTDISIISSTSVSYHWQSILELVLQQNSFGSGIWVSILEQSRDQITHVSNIIILYRVMCPVLGQEGWCAKLAIVDPKGGSLDPKRWPPPCMWCGISSMWHLTLHIVCVLGNRSVEDVTVDHRGGHHRSQEVAPAMCLSWHFAPVALGSIRRSLVSG